MVGSQTTSLIHDLSFYHNLCFKCANESWKPILDIYVSIDFQWYKELSKLMCFDPCNRILNIRDSIWIPTPTMGVHLGVWGFIPSHFLHFREHVMWLPGLPLGPQPCNPLALVASSRLGLQHCTCNEIFLHPPYLFSLHRIIEEVLVRFAFIIF